MKQSANPPCPICERSSAPQWPIHGWGEMRLCSSCGLLFANPMALPTSTKELFSQAYNGTIEADGMEQFAYRLQRREALLKAGKSALTATHIHSLAWILQNIPRGSKVMDIGCGLGLFLYTLRSEGYQPIGIEPGELPATTLQREGFEVWHGTLDDYPASWTKPDVVTCFHMLHHLDDPAGFLRLIAQRFPVASMLVGQYHARVYARGNHRADGVHPPRTLTLWTPQALERALTRAGYEAKVQELLPTGREVSIPGVMSVYFSHKRIPATLIRLFLWGRPRFLALLALLQRHSGARYYLWALGTPLRSDQRRELRGS